MTRALLLALGLTFGLALPASAACYADYKAKRENPYQLQYGVIELAERDCSPGAAAAAIAARIAADGWQLLAVVSIFDEAGLAARRDSAGGFFLRY